MFHRLVDHRTATRDQNVTEQKKIGRRNKKYVIAVHEGSAGRVARRPWAAAEKSEENNNNSGTVVIIRREETIIGLPK